MSKYFLRACLLGAVVVVLASCGSSPKKPGGDAPQSSDMGQLPDWMMPCTVEDSIAACSCTKIIQGNMSIAKSQAVAQARNELASLLRVKVNRMVKNYQRQVTTAQGASIGGTFEDVSKQLTSEVLVGTTVRHEQPAMIAGAQQYCVQMAQLNKAAFDAVANLAREQGAQIDPTSEAALYEEFRATKAQDELNQELQNLRP